jgi:hypothetical protein
LRGEKRKNEKRINTENTKGEHRGHGEKWHADTRSLSRVAAERPAGRREDMGGSRKVEMEKKKPPVKPGRSTD